MNGMFSAQELEGMFRPLDPFRRVVVAVSGGGDSMALMLLLAAWARERPVSLLVATVDHGLQPQSLKVAQNVVAEAQRRGLCGKVLSWLGDKPETALQEAARQARYALLLDYAQKEDAGAIVTAHTADDQRETLLMRLLRGSGPRGLAAMDVEREVAAGSGVSLLRPLLHVTRAQLRAVCAANGVLPFDDPANENTGFTRARLRQLMPLLEAEGFTVQRAALLAKRMAAQNLAMDQMAGDLSAMVPGSVLPWRDAPFAVVQLALAQVIDHYGRRDIAERLTALETLTAQLLAALKAGRAFAATLRGTVLRLSADGRLSVKTAPARRK